jgi:glycerate kinase
MTTTRRRVVLIAPDKFKGSLTAPEVAAALAAGVTAARPDLQVVTCPVADGGEGTVAAALASGFRSRTVTVRGPLGHPVAAVFARKGSTAVVELAQASGLHLLPEPGACPQTAVAATTYGTGELLLAALDAGANTIVVGLGGSATTDGGAGMLQALGARFHDGGGELLGPGLARPGTIASADLAGLDPRIAMAEVVVATDVDNPLSGPRGAAAVFGPQKGATPEVVGALDEDLRRWSRVLSRAGVTANPQQPGAGAAGGAGFAALGVLRARARPGVDVVLDIVGFDELLAGASLVVTGEGSLDEQSLGGKAPVGVLRAAVRRGVPTVVVAGRSTLEPDVLARTGFAAVYTLQDLEPDLATSIREAPRLLRDVGRAVAAFAAPEPAPP